MKFSQDALIEEETLDINLTPLIDIVFLLLIFFMVSTTFDTSAGISVSLPSAATSELQDRKEPLTIAISADNTLYLDEKPVTLEEVSAFFSEHARTGTNIKLIVRADKSADHGTVVAVMDRAKEAGINKLAVAAELVP